MVAEKLLDKLADALDLGNPKAVKTTNQGKLVG